MVDEIAFYARMVAWLSVLALSSRFDGPDVESWTQPHQHSFQYSLCRVVLMVHMDGD